MDKENHLDSSEIRQLKSQIESLKKRKSDLVRSSRSKIAFQARKERARRLIETGALAEKYFKIENLSINEREELFKTFSNFIVGNKPDHLKK